MSEEMKLKPCPICGGKAIMAWDDFVEVSICRCDDPKCGFELWGGTAEQWNTRPIEDELRTEINKLSTVYVVTMYRFGDRDKHSYVLGVWSDKAEADKHANAEVDYRGGKYKADVLKVVVNAEPEGWAE